MINKENIVKITKEILNSEKENFQDKTIFFVDLKISNDNRITVNIDSFEGIKIADCATISKLIESKLDREKEDFELLVSSAGLTNPLKVIEQYKKNIGKSIKILSVDGEKSKGKLTEVLENGIKIIPELSKKKKKNITENQEELFFEFQYIKEVKVVITF